MKHIFIALSLLSIGTTSQLSAQTQSVSKNAQYYDISTFDIVGVKIGMKPDEVFKILTQKGFSVKPLPLSTNFAKEVYEKSSKLRQPMPKLNVVNGPSLISGSDSQGNEIYASFIGLATGPELVSITLVFNGRTNQVNKLEENIVAKYGAPSHITSTFKTNVWCGKSDNNCLNPHITGPGSSVVFYHTNFIGKHEIILTNRGPAEETLKKQVNSYFSAPTSKRQESLLSGGK